MKQQTKLARLIRLMRRQYVTPVQALMNCGLFSLSQRCGELERKHGYKLSRKWVTTKSGSKVMSYRIVEGSSK